MPKNCWISLHDDEVDEILLALEHNDVEAAGERRARVCAAVTRRILDAQDELDDPDRAAYWSAAEADTDDDLNVDEDAAISKAEDGTGAWIMSWIWIGRSAVRLKRRSTTRKGGTRGQ